MKKRILSLLVVLSLGLVPSFTSVSAENDAEEILPLIYEIAPEYNLSPEFVAAVCFYESSFRNDVRSSCGNEGCMQLSPTLFEHDMKEQGIDSLTDAEGSIRIACDHLRDLFIEFGDDDYLVLMCYSQGRARGKKNFDAGNFSSYAINVTEYAALLTQQRGMEFEDDEYHRY